VVITGPSGSGKSSLAFDTLFAEGQRQYIESLSVSARQFLSQLERPDVDEITGLEPVVCIDQRFSGANPRSTVATATEICDYLRLLFARLGEISCHQCGQPIRQQSIEQIEDALAAPPGTKLMLLGARSRSQGSMRNFDAIRKVAGPRAGRWGDFRSRAVPPPTASRIDRSDRRSPCRAVVRVRGWPNRCSSRCNRGGNRCRLLSRPRAKPPRSGRPGKRSFD
jgi:excinuclease ABC subunit A